MSSSDEFSSREEFGFYLDEKWGLTVISIPTIYSDIEVQLYAIPSGFIHLEICHKTATLGPEPVAAWMQAAGSASGRLLRAAADTAEAAWLQVHWRGSAWGDATL